MRSEIAPSAAWTCPFCGDGRSAQATTCMGCGFFSTLDDRGVHRVSHDKGNVGYPEDGNAKFAELEEESFWFQHRNKLIQGLLERFPVRGTLLDVGGGSGFQAAMIQKGHSPTVLLEPGLFGCHKARERGVRNVINGTLEAVQVTSGSIGAISFFDVIEHLSDPVPILRKAHSLLGVGGKLLVTVPAYGLLWSHEDEYACHFRRYTRRFLRSLLTGTGFTLDYASYCFQALVLPILATRAIPYRLGLKREAGSDKGDHRAGGLLGSALKLALTREAAQIREGRELPFGSSLIAVASKPTN